MSKTINISGYQKHYRSLCELLVVNLEHHRVISELICKMTIDNQIVLIYREVKTVAMEEHVVFFK